MYACAASAVDFAVPALLATIRLIMNFVIKVYSEVEWFMIEAREPSIGRSLSEATHKHQAIQSGWAAGRQITTHQSQLGTKLK